MNCLPLTKTTKLFFEPHEPRLAVKNRQQYYTCIVIECTKSLFQTVHQKKSMNKTFNNIQKKIMDCYPKRERTINKKEDEEKGHLSDVV